MKKQDINRLQQENTGFQPAGKLAIQALQYIADMLQSNDLPGLPTGFQDLDRMTGGLLPANLIILAGLPSVGKTSFCCNIASYLALHKDQPVVIFSPEMCKDALTTKILCSEAGVNSHNLRKGHISAQDGVKLLNIADKFTNAPLYINDQSTLSIETFYSQLKDHIVKMSEEGKPLPLVIIDNIQLLKGTGKSDSKYDELTGIVRSLKVIARDLNLSIIAVSQLSRKPITRPNYIPELSDLRDSGALEEDSDIVMFIHREAVINDDPDIARNAQLIIKKHRNGPTGEIPLVFIKEYGQFKDITLSDSSGNSIANQL
jgi:replicative DNA helicase